MTKILLVKTSSMGDLIQTFPALTDASRAIPGIRFDWLVEDSFQVIPKLHPSIDTVFSIPYRTWKNNLLKTCLNGDILSFLREIRAKRYDMIIDAQSNIKSALFSFCASGKRYGVDATSVREFGAHFFYHQTTTISRQQHHTDRLRQLFATHLNYPLPQTPPDYGILNDTLPNLTVFLPDKFIFITPIASVKNKLWPEAYWKEVIQHLVSMEYSVVMPWWSDDEKARVLRLQQGHPAVHILPKLDLLQKASVMAKATAAISLDTGLAHIAAALNIPNITLYGPGDYKTCGTAGYRQIHLIPQSPACVPCESGACSYFSKTVQQSPCLASIKPQQVLTAFQALF